MSAANWARPNGADRETAFTRLAQTRDDIDPAVMTTILRSLAHPGLPDEALELAWDDLCEAVDRLRDLETGALEPYDIDENLVTNDHDAAKDSCCAYVDEALFPLLHGWDVGQACRQCRRDGTPVHRVRMALPHGRGLCPTCAIRARGHLQPEPAVTT